MVTSVYLETTVVSYFVAPPSRDVVIAARQESTRQLWPKLLTDYECYVSVLVREVASRGDEVQASLRLQAIVQLPMLELGVAADELAFRMIEAHSIPATCPEDALHIALAAANGIDVMITWNFAHLNNPFTRSTVRRIVEAAGYQCPEICSPDELLEAVI